MMVLLYFFPSFHLIFRVLFITPPSIFPAFTSSSSSVPPQPQPPLTTNENRHTMTNTSRTSSITAARGTLPSSLIHRPILGVSCGSPNLQCWNDNHNASWSILEVDHPWNPSRKSSYHSNHEQMEHGDTLQLSLLLLRLQWLLQLLQLRRLFLLLRLLLILLLLLLLPKVAPCSWSFVKCPWVSTTLSMVNCRETGIPPIRQNENSDWGEIFPYSCGKDVSREQVSSPFSSPFQGKNDKSLSWSNDEKISEGDLFE